MIAKPCCGSCENFGDYDIYDNYICKFNGKVVTGIDYSCDIYFPRNPIKSKHELMWDELKALFVKTPDVEDFKNMIKYIEGNQ